MSELPSTSRVCLPIKSGDLVTEGPLKREKRVLGLWSVLVQTLVPIGTLRDPFSSLGRINYLVTRCQLFVKKSREIALSFST
jgi:hypothetical protein